MVLLFIYMSDWPFDHDACHIFVVLWYTVESRYLELEFYEIRCVYLNRKNILIAFSNHSLAFETFLQVQITRSAN